MNGIEWVPLISYSLITIFSPGPNNISGMSSGVLYGYKRTLKYISGIAFGFFLLMILDALIAVALLTFLPNFESFLRIAGSLYIAWLAFEILKKSFNIEVNQQPPMSFWRGLFLQILNPKAIIFGLTIFVTFLAPLRGNLQWQISVAVVLAILSFTSCSLWTLSGAAIKKYLDKPGIQRIVNGALALLLFYSAIERSGLIPWIRSFFLN